MLFEWDETKNATNRRKHRLSFGAATAVFDDPNELTLFDDYVDGEERWQTIGRVPSHSILLVVHTDRQRGSETLVRIISARPATPKERRLYQDNVGSNG